MSESAALVAVSRFSDFLRWKHTRERVESFSTAVHTVRIIIVSSLDSGTQPKKNNVDWGWEARGGKLTCGAGMRLLKGFGRKRLVLSEDADTEL